MNAEFTLCFINLVKPPLLVQLVQFLQGFIRWQICLHECEQLTICRRFRICYDLKHNPGGMTKHLGDLTACFYQKRRQERVGA